MTSRQSGFGLVEALVALFALSVLTAGALTLVDAVNRMATAQSATSELQNNLRVAQQEVVRMLDLAGIGGLPKGIDPGLAGNASGGVFPTGLALAIANNVPPDTHVGDETTPRVVAGSDVLTVRGVLTTPVVFLEPQVPLALDSDGRISLVVRQEVDIGVGQDLEALRRALAVAKAAEHPEALIVRDRFNPGMYAVLKLDPPATFPGDPGDPTLAVGLVLSSEGGAQSHADEYGRLILGTRLPRGAGGNRATLPDGTRVELPKVIGSLGILEEYRFYVREAWDGPGADRRATPVLSRIRFYPGTEAVHPEGSLDLTDGILDLQTALGVDLADGDGIFDGRVLDAGDAVDEVLFNHPEDDDGLAAGSVATWSAPGSQLLFVRLSLVAQAPRPDRSFDGIVLGAFEDHDHADPGELSIFNTGPNPKVRKRHLQTLVELRNLP